MELKQFLELFNPLPGNHYIQITDKIDATTLALQKLISEVDGEFHLALYAEEKPKIPDELSDTKIQLITNLSNPFRALPRDNDMVIFKDILLQHKNPQLLLRITYTTLANTADVIIMQEKGTMDIRATKEMLEKFEFRAPNEIDILDEFDLVMAKKMHMWGNGL
ncbi:hypothetical protein [Sulfurimonas autotrophica]|uniref:Uncharacterized protein n=1 Tax=Sulfurimonas autotrophica (strain ATCC BAA-671 / DSM 16294 / JCM 11897 / OK10) TaxID=563040 RepID=E0UR23_SULAO|nr:hypothetical protein [Sulfurimonas autotrophica]ADN09979.1 conserved hypothetical protein [Sulfurimonas autotrophica DSM 16294]